MGAFRKDYGWALLVKQFIQQAEGSGYPLRLGLLSILTGLFVFVWLRAWDLVIRYWRIETSLASKAALQK